MKLTSHYPETVFWRIFSKKDIHYLVGLSDGFLNDGETVDIHYNDVHYQLEIKVGGLLGAFLEKANTTKQWTNDDVAEINGLGQLVTSQLPSAPERLKAPKRTEETCEVLELRIERLRSLLQDPTPGTNTTAIKRQITQLYAKARAQGCAFAQN